MRETWVLSLGQEDSLEKEMATHSSTLAWKIPWTEELGAGYCAWVTKSQAWLSDFTFTFHFTSLYGVKMNEITSTILKIFRVKDGELKTNMFSIWDSIGLFRELNIIPSKPWLKLIGHQWSIFSKAGDCMLRCIICTLPIYWSIIYLSLCYTYRYMYAYTCIKKLCTMYMIDNIMCLLFSITIY